MVRPDTDARHDRRSSHPHTSVRAPPKKAGGGGRFTVGKMGEIDGGATVDHDDPNYDPDERRIDPEDGLPYKHDELVAFYQGRFDAQQIAEYWDYQCTLVRRRSRAKQEKPVGPSLEESAALAAKPKAKTMTQVKKEPVKRLTPEDLEGGGPLAKEVAAVLPFCPYKNVEKFVDVQDLLKHPALFNAVCAVMAKRIRAMGVTKIAALEAHGMLFAPVAIKTSLPFVLLRSKGMVPNTISKEHEGLELCVQRGIIKEGDKVVLLDDLLITGRTLRTGLELLKECKAEVVECCCLVELESQGGRDRCLKAGAKAVWSFVGEDLLTERVALPEGYVDDTAERRER